jgi:cytochrome d ubiquinol oxidase subunit II
MLETLIGAIMVAALIVYALMGGADYGGGMWDLLASGPRAKRQRQAIVEAIAPIWEANHVWLILVIVLLFSGFPRAFSAIMIALHIPITAMLIGIVLRGSAFVFRKYDSTEDAVQRRWSTIFGIASFFTPFFQGLTLGALTTGNIHLVGDQVTTGFFAGWLTPFALTCGLFALALFAFLAATYMTVAVQSQPDLQDDFRRRAIWAQTALIPLAIIVFATSKYGAPLMFHGLTNWWAPVLLGWTGLSAIVAAFGLWSRRFNLARTAAVA